MSQSPLRLNNLYAKSSPLFKLSVTVSEPDYDYIFRGCMAGEHGSIQSILSHFWSKFTRAVREDLKLPTYYKPNHPEAIAGLLEKLNFNDTTSLQEQITSLQNDLATLRSKRSGRTNPRPSKSKKQPLPSDRKRSGTRNGRSKVPDTSRPTEGAEGNGNSEAKGETGEETRREGASIA